MRGGWSSIWTRGAAAVGVGRGASASASRLGEGVPLHQIVVHADLAALPAGQIDGVDVRALALQVLGQPLQGQAHLRLGHHVRVKDEIDDAIIERDVVPVGEKDGAAGIVAPLEIPDAEQGDGAEPLAGERVRLLLALGHPERLAGSASWARQTGGQSSRIRSPCGSSYLITVTRPTLSATSRG